MSTPHHDGLDNLNAAARRAAVAEVFRSYDCALAVIRLVEIIRVVIAFAAAGAGRACACGRFPPIERQSWNIPTCYTCLARDKHDDRRLRKILGRSPRMARSTRIARLVEEMIG